MCGYVQKGHHHLCLVALTQQMSQKCSYVLIFKRLFDDRHLSHVLTFRYYNQFFALQSLQKRNANTSSPTLSFLAHKANYMLNEILNKVTTCLHQQQPIIHIFEIVFSEPKINLKLVIIGFVATQFDVWC